MKKKILSVILVITLVISVCGCKQTIARDFGGDITIELEPNQKLEMITWKDADLWYLTRPMTANDIAETHVFQESSTYGVMEGTVTIIESKE